MVMTLIELEQKIVRMREQGANNNTPISVSLETDRSDGIISGDLKSVKRVMAWGQWYIELRG